MKWIAFHPRAADYLGFIPQMLNELDPRDAVTQLAAGYAHGGGWRDFSGFKMGAGNSLKYPGDPAIKPVAETTLRDELIIVYPHAWVAVIQPSGSFRVCRMD